MSYPSPFRELDWVIEVYQRGSLVDMVGPYSINFIGPYFRSYFSRYLPADGYKVRLVGYK